jgi:two-component system, sensor histidine kinase YesM
MNSLKSIWGYVRNYNFNSILLKNFMLFFLLMVLPVVGTSALVYRYNQSVMGQEIASANMNALSRIRDSVDMVMGETERLSIRLMSDPDIGTFMIDPNTYPLEYNKVNRIHRIQQILQISVLTNELIDSIFIYSEANNRVLTSDYSGEITQYSSKWWQDSYEENKGRYSSWVTRLQREMPDRPAKKDYITYFGTTTLQGTSSKGSVMINLDADKLGQLLHKAELEQGGEIYLLNGIGTILYNRDPAKLNSQIERSNGTLGAILNTGVHSQIITQDGLQQIISIVESSYKDWRYISSVPLEAYHLKQLQLQRFVAVLTLLGLSLCLVLAFIVSVRGFRPIRRIITMIENKSTDGLFPDKRSYGKLDEIKFIAASLETSLDKQKEMEDELEVRYSKLKKAQTIALQSQINPHFLFNTLESINWKVMGMTSGKNEGSKMIQALSRLLSFSLETRDHVVLLARELEHAKLYVEIQKMRYKDRFEVQWNIEKTAFSFKIIKLTIQPIIENAIYHGIKPSDRPGTIIVSGNVQQDSFILKVRDNGIGMSKSETAQLNSGLKNNDVREDRHIGLRNVNQRIRLIFGEDYGLKVRSIAGRGTIVVLTLPKIK